MAFITVTNSFVNSTAADASQVNTNFSDIINGTSDGTKDFSISALTVGGAFTLSGTFSSNFTPTANTTYNIGTATSGLQYLYLGGTSTFTARLAAATLAASRNYTVPEIGADASFVMSQGVSTITNGTTTLTTASKVILCNSTSGVITVNLPAASTMSGQTLTIKKTSSDTNAVTIDADGSETIDGALTEKVYGQYGIMHLICDGSNWHILHVYDLVSFTPTLTVDVGGGSTSSVAGTWSRNGRIKTVVVSADYTGMSGVVQISFAKSSLPDGGPSTVLQGSGSVRRSNSSGIGGTFGFFSTNCQIVVGATEIGGAGAFIATMDYYA